MWVVLPPPQGEKWVVQGFFLRENHPHLASGGKGMTLAPSGKERPRLPAAGA